MRRSPRLAPLHGSFNATSFVIAALVASSQLGASRAHAQTATWSEFGPPTRADHTMIVDPVRSRLVLFGGQEGSTKRDDVWAFSLTEPGPWERIQVFGPGPSARIRTTAIYDPVGDRMIVFGGNDGADRNDAWALSLSGAPTWTLLAPSGTPPSPRSGHVAVYDPPGQRMIVIGAGATFETWALSLSGPEAWTQLATSGGPPPARSNHAAAFDSQRRRVVMFGGESGVPLLADTWVLSLDDLQWQAVPPNGSPPEARTRAVAIYDAPRDRVLLLGGYRGGSYETSTAWQVKALALAGVPTWSDAGVMVRRGHAAVYDAAHDRVITSGGSDYAALFSSTEARPAAGGSSTLLVSDPVPYIGFYGGITAYDPVRNRMIAAMGAGVGDCTDVCAAGVLSAFALDGERGWTNQHWWAPTRIDASAVIDPVRDRVVYFGGTHVYGADPLKNDAWAFDMSGEQAGWLTEIVPSGAPPSPRRAHSAVYDPKRDRMIVFGGTGDNFVLAYGGPFLNDVWALEFSPTPTWTQLSPAGTPPAARAGQLAVYDPAGDRIVVFGGNNGSWRNDAWALSLGATPTWSAISATGSAPASPSEPTGIYDPVRERLVVFSAGSAWTLGLGPTPAWAPLAANGLPPTNRIEVTASYDPLGDRMLVFGGSRSPAVYALAFDGSAVSVDPPPSPRSVLALAGASPNPVLGDLTVAFTLPDASPARLELIDVAGRRVAVEEVGSLGAGSHRVRLGDAPRLGAGLYFVRLVSGTQRLTAKATVLSR